MLREIEKNFTFEDQKLKNKIALWDYADDPLGQPRVLTYRQLSFYNSSVARKLLKLGYQPEDRIAIIGLNSYRFITTYLGTRLAGMTSVVINHKLSKAQIEHVINHSEAKLVLHDPEFLDLLPESIDKISFADFEKWVEYQETVYRYEHVGSRTTLMLYTSGSTGSPKCISIKANSRQWAVKSLLAFPQTARTIIAQPLSHINGLNAMESNLLNKSSVIILPKFDVESYKHAIFNSNVSRVVAIPAMMAMLLDDPENLKLMKAKANVRAVMLSGAPTSEGLFDKITAAFPEATVRLTYGMSEIGPGIFGGHPSIPWRKMSVGCEREGIKYKLVDDVLFIKTPGLFDGYYKDESKTNASYDEEGYFNTRDKFRVDEDGFYFFMGRADDMFVSGGENIYPGEVEDILNGHPSILESCVIGLEDDIKGTKAYAFVRTNGEFDEQAIKDWYATQGPTYQIPRRIWAIDVFPLTFISKVDKRQLEEMAKKLLAEQETE
jgi:acyl-coenzyme A synthetase/AMP-(fatty) acid ligase